MALGCGLSFPAWSCPGSVLVVPGSPFVAFALFLVLGGSRFSGGRRPQNRSFPLVLSRLQSVETCVLGRYPLFLRHGILDLIADPFAIDALMMDNTKEISRHCTVLQPRSYLQSSIPIFLHN